MLAAVGIVALAHLAAFAAPPTGPSIVGEWRGHWASRRDLGVSGRYFMTIKKIEGSRVFTRLYIVGVATFEGDREATLSGKTLTFVTPSSEAAFTIEDSWMHGTVRSRSSGIVEEEVSLTRTAVPWSPRGHHGRTSGQAVPRAPSPH